MLLGPVGIRNQAVLVVCCHQVLQYSSRLEDAELHAVGCFVRHGRDTPIGVNLSKPRLLLLVLEYIDWYQLYDVVLCQSRFRHSAGRKKKNKKDIVTSVSTYLVLKPKLLQSDVDFQSVRRALAVRSDIGLGLGRHLEIMPACLLACLLALGGIKDVADICVYVCVCV